LQPNLKYGYTVTAEKMLYEGCILTTKLFIDEREMCSFNACFWNNKTYENALKSAGFQSVQWQKLIISTEGIKKFGKKFWKDFQKQSGVIAIECKK
jgi:toxoflavin synthase